MKHSFADMIKPRTTEKTQRLQTKERADNLETMINNVNANVKQIYGKIV